MNPDHRTLLYLFSLVILAALAPDPSRARAEGAGDPDAPSRFAVLPQGLASFGACASGDWLYVYGGHVGRAHEHSRDNVATAFRRLNLLDLASWEDLPAERALQGAALVAHGGAVYRLGGLDARNRRGEEEDLHSSAEASAYDPLRRTWRALPPLPEPRSSHDAALIGSRVFVVGGWKLEGPSKTWHRTAWALDLARPEPSWEAIPEPPFERRALAAATAEGKLFVIGGMTPDGEISPSTDIFDPATGVWSKGPSLPGNGFGVAAAAWDGTVHASGMDGTLWRLAPAGDRWDDAAFLALPRFFHRLIPSSRGLMAVGGAAHGAHLRVIETVAGADVAWRVFALPYAGRARNRQGMVLRGNELHVFGGNKSPGQHDFAPENFLGEAFRVNLGSLTEAPIEDFPERRQSMSAVLVDSGAQGGVHGSRGDPRAFVVGGFGPDGEAARSHAEVFEYRPKAGTWTKVAARLPSPRSQLGLAARGSVLWVFGGLDYDPSRGKEAAFRHPTEVLTWDSSAEGASFGDSGHRLPRPRRAFGGADLEDRYYLVGGLQEGFQVVSDCDVFDWKTLAWTRMASPSKPRISPELAALGGKLYLAGGTSPKDGGAFELNTSLECYEPAVDRWTTILEKLPVHAAHVRVFPFQKKLLFASVGAEAEGLLRMAIFTPPLPIATAGLTDG